MIRNDNLYLILSLMHGWSNSTQWQVKPYTVRVLEAIIEFVQIWYLFWQPDKIFSVSILNGIVWRAQDDTWPIYFSSFWRFACTKLGMCTNRKLSGIRRTVPHVRSYYTCTIVHVSDIHIIFVHKLFFSHWNSCSFWTHSTHHIGIQDLWKPKEDAFLQGSYRHASLKIQVFHAGNLFR